LLSAGGGSPVKGLKSGRRKNAGRNRLERGKFFKKGVLPLTLPDLPDKFCGII